MKPLLLYFSLILSTTAFSQLFINGADFVTNPSSLVYVNNDSLLIDNNAQVIQNGFLRVDKDLINNSGTLLNDGDIYIYNDIIINDIVQGITNLSNFYLNGDWINNNVFSSGQSLVSLIGNIQDIGGTENTSFYNLTAQGTLADVKSLVGVNAVVLNQLDLTDVEFATDINTLSVYNPAQNAILRNTGFVSSLDAGRLERVTNTTATYLFPTGSSLGVFRYRPLEISPNTNIIDTFGVRLANTDATNEGFDVLVLGDSLCAVNPSFYHRIYGNSDAALTMFYIPQDDGDWDAMGQWQGSNDWEKLPDEFSSNSGQFSSITVPSWTDYSNAAFALGVQKPNLDLDDELTINPGESIDLLPNYQGVNPQNVSWFPLDQISCPNCLETGVSPLLSTQYNLEITVNQFCTIQDSVLVIVSSEGLYLPTAFSPNQDGTNDGFRPLNSNIETYAISIFNRWGELIYKSNDKTVGWDGTYNGKNAGLGVYSYTAEYSFTNQPEIETQTGNITLIR